MSEGIDTAVKYGIYSEDGWEANVAILEDHSDCEWHRYKLQVISTIQKPYFTKTPEDGTIFDFEQAKNMGAWKWMGRLEIDPT